MSSAAVKQPIFVLRDEDDEDWEMGFRHGPTGKDMGKDMGKDTKDTKDGKDSKRQSSATARERRNSADIIGEAPQLFALYQQSRAADEARAAQDAIDRATFSQSNGRSSHSSQSSRGGNSQSSSSSSRSSSSSMALETKGDEDDEIDGPFALFMRYHEASLMNKSVESRRRELLTGLSARAREIPREQIETWIMHVAEQSGGAPTARGYFTYEVKLHDLLSNFSTDSSAEIKAIFHHIKSVDEVKGDDALKKLLTSYDPATQVIVHMTMPVSDAGRKLGITSLLSTFLLRSLDGKPDAKYCAFIVCTKRRVDAQPGKKRQTYVCPRCKAAHYCSSACLLKDKQLHAKFHCQSRTMGSGSQS